MTVRNAASMGTYGSDWQARGYAGKGNVGELLGSLTGRQAIICGGAAGVFEELAAAQAVLPEAVIFAVNEVGMFLPKVDHWVSLHADNLWAWKVVRDRHPRSAERLKTHSETPRGWLDYVWEQLTPEFCLSGYFAMQLAWIMGADRIVLCGCPGDGTPRFFEARCRERADSHAPLDGFAYGQGTASSDVNIVAQVQREMERVSGFKDAVRSMSGWTREFFGSI